MKRTITNINHCTVLPKGSEDTLIIPAISNFCGNCGELRNPNANYCTKCGTPTSELVKEKPSESGSLPKLG
jgi:ribosomal protein L32